MQHVAALAHRPDVVRRGAPDVVERCAGAARHFVPGTPVPVQERGAHRPDVIRGAAPDSAQLHAHRHHRQAHAVPVERLAALAHRPEVIGRRAQVSLKVKPMGRGLIQQNPSREHTRAAPPAKGPQHPAGRWRRSSLHPDTTRTRASRRIRPAARRNPSPPRHKSEARTKASRTRGPRRPLRSSAPAGTRRSPRGRRTRPASSRSCASPPPSTRVRTRVRASPPEGRPGCSCTRPAPTPAPAPRRTPSLDPSCRSPRLTAAAREAWERPFRISRASVGSAGARGTRVRK